ncbi:4010_t:CDS:2, partial [Ambispora leptoticha]
VIIFVRSFSTSFYASTSLRNAIRESYIDAMAYKPRKLEEMVKNIVNDSIKETGTIVSPSPVREQQHSETPISSYDLSISLLLSAGCHLGHSTSLWNPSTSPFIYGTRAGISIIDLEQTLIYLRRACKVTREISFLGGIILFIGTRPGIFGKVTIEAAKRAEAYQVAKRWIPGTITNSSQVLRKMLLEDQERAASNRDPQQQEVLKAFKPDLMIILNPIENQIAIAEAHSANIPTIGIVDSDFDPGRVSYPIPANDDSVRSVELIAGVLSVAARDGLNHRRKIEGDLEKKKQQEITQKGVGNWNKVLYQKA